MCELCGWSSIKFIEPVFKRKNDQNTWFDAFYFCHKTEKIKQKYLKENEAQMKKEKNNAFEIEFC